MGFGAPGLELVWLIQRDLLIYHDDVDITQGWTVNNTQFRSLYLTAILLAIGLMAPGESIVRADDVAVWRPQHTRVFLVSLTHFKGGRLHSFSTDDRLDDRFAQLFRDRGVPANQIVLLKDDTATTQNIQSQFTNLLRQSHLGETLFFYFGSHGGYDRKTGEFSYCAFNDNVNFTWVFDEIERTFRGNQAILAADCCYSGGLTELALKRKTPIAYACLSSTSSHQTAHSGWRFAQCLIRGLTGNPVVDLDGNGHVDLDELAFYTKRYMAFVAEGMPMFQVTGGFNSKLRLATTARSCRSREGELLEIQSNGAWKKAEVLDAQPNRLRVHFTEDTRTVNDAWYTTEHARPFRYESYATGSVVEILNQSGKTWYTAKVLDHWESIHLCRFDGYSSNYDEWVGPSRIRKSVAGSWSGHWKNSLDQSGPETLDLVTGKDETLSGTWSGDVPLIGWRIGNSTIYFEGTKPGRFYRCAGRIEGSQLRLNYVAHRTKSTGKYHGIAQLSQQVESLNPTGDARFEFAGNWTGTYENSLGGSGSENLTLTENAEQLHGVWSGVDVSGERLGDATIFLEGALRQRHYRIVGHVIEGRLILDYIATTSNEYYHGRSTLNH
jgi:hypothetical protein